MSKKETAMDRYEFINTVIGEGSEDLWKEIINSDTLYNTLMAQDNEDISDAIAQRLSKKTINELNHLSSKHCLNINVIDIA